MAWSSAGSCLEISSVPMPYIVIIERLMSCTLRRSSEAPVVTWPKTMCSVTRPPEQHDHVVEQLLLGLEVAILLGQVERVPERLSARDDRDPVHLLDRLEQLGAECVPGLVVGHHALLVLGDHVPRLDARDHPLERALEVRGADLPPVVAPGDDRRPRCRGWRDPRPSPARPGDDLEA